MPPSVTLASLRNPTPVIVTLVPSVDPMSGETEVTDGGGPDGTTTGGGVGDVG
jgi:hypothetical protein